MLEGMRGIYFIDPEDQDYKRNRQKCEDKIGEAHGTSHAVQENGSQWHHESVCKAGQCI